MVNHEKAKAIKNIVNSYYGIDVSAKSRKFPYIKGRVICYKIMRDEFNMTYNDIARHFNKNHATILSALKDFPFLTKFDPIVQKEYIEIKHIWFKEADQYQDVEPYVIKKELKKLREQNKMLNLSLIDVQRRLNKYKSLVHTLEERVPEERMAELEMRIRHIINGL